MMELVALKNFKSQNQKFEAGDDVVESDFSGDLSVWVDAGFVGLKDDEVYETEVKYPGE